MTPLTKKLTSVEFMMLVKFDVAVKPQFKPKPHQTQLIKGMRLKSQ